MREGPLKIAGQHLVFETGDLVRCVVPMEGLCLDQEYRVKSVNGKVLVIQNNDAARFYLSYRFVLAGTRRELT